MERRSRELSAGVPHNGPQYLSLQGQVQRILFVFLRAQQEGTNYQPIIEVAGMYRNVRLSIKNKTGVAVNLGIVYLASTTSGILRISESKQIVYGY